MIDNEYNSFQEIKKTDEYQYYKAVHKNINNELEKNTNESFISFEYSSFQKEKHSEKNNKGIIKKFIQKLSESSVLAGTVAGTALVAVVSFIVFSSMLVKSPNVKLLDLFAGYDYVTYNLYIDEMDEDIEYYSIVQNSFERYEFRLFEGENYYSVSSLMHDMEYELIVIGVSDDEDIEIKYFSTFFYTTSDNKYIKVKWIVEGDVVLEDEIEFGEEAIYKGDTPFKASNSEFSYEFLEWEESIDENACLIYTAVFAEVINEYSANYNKISASDVVINYDNPDYYVLSFNTGFDSSDLRMGYRIILYDEINDDTYTYEGRDSIASINVSSSVSKLSITYESIGVYDGIEKVFESVTINEVLEISSISLNIDDNLDLVETNTYRLLMGVDSNLASDEVYNFVNLNIVFDDLSEDEIIIDNFNVNELFEVDILVPEYCASFSVDYTIDLLGANGHNSRIVKGSKNFTLESSMELIRVYVDNKDYMTARFLFKYHLADSDSTICVVDSLSSNVFKKNDGEEYIEISIDSGVSNQEFKYYIASLDGDIIGVENSLSVDYLDVSGVYSFDYVNPGDSVVTYNEDSSMNIYIDTFFESDDIDIWYLVRYTDFNNYKIYDIKYTDSIAFIEDIPFSDYGIEYFVYKNVNGINYQLERISVSGGIEITNDNICYTELIENSEVDVNVYISFSSYSNVILDSFILYVDGVEYLISQNDFVLNGSEYEINYKLSSKPNELVLEYQGSYNQENLYELISSKIDLKGNQYRKMYVVLL